jgi:hypothetical protein
MDFAKTDCFGGGPSLEALVLFAVLMVAGALYVWSSLRRPRTPEWSLTGRTRRRG